MASSARAKFDSTTSSPFSAAARSEEHTSELPSRRDLVCRLLLEKKKWFHLLSSPSDYAEEAEFARKLIVDASSTQPKLLLELGSGGGNNVFFFNDPATTEIYTLSLHDALPI